MSHSPFRPKISDRQSGTSALIASNVVNLREERGLSTTALALETGWPVSRIAAIEAGRDEGLHLDDLDVLATALGVGPAALFA